MNMYRNDVQRMASAQRAYDHMTPPDDPVDFLETIDGQNWLDGAAIDLVGGHDLKIDRKTKVEQHDLWQSISVQLKEKIAADDGYYLEQIIQEIADRGPSDSKLFGLLNLIFEKPKSTCSTWTSIHELASELCSPHADAALKEMIEKAA